MTILDGTPQSPRHRAGRGEQRPTVTQLLRSNPTSQQQRHWRPAHVVQPWNPSAPQNVPVPPPPPAPAMSSDPGPGSLARPTGHLVAVPPANFVLEPPADFVLEPPTVPTPRFEDLLRELDREPEPPVASVQQLTIVDSAVVESTGEVQNVYTVHDSVVQTADVAPPFAATPHVTGPDVAPEVPSGEQPYEGADRPRGGIVTVFSPKGGAGTTFVAVNLALLLGDHGRRRVCLVDADLQFGDVAIMAGLAPNRTMVDIVGRDLTDPDAAVGLVTQLVAPWTGGVDTLLAPVDPSAAEQVTPEVMTAVLLALRSMYDYVVVDTPSQLSEHVVEALEIADRQILVCTAEVAALKNMRLVLDTLNLLGHGPARRSVVLNCTDAARPLGHADVEEAIVHPVAASIPYGAEVSVSVDDAQPLVLGRADHPVGAALRRFTCDVITGEVQPVRKRGLLGGRLTKGRTAR